MSTSAKTLIAAPVIYNELKDAEEKAIAVLGLLEDVIQPAFGDLRRCGRYSPDASCTARDGNRKGGRTA